MADVPVELGVLLLGDVLLRARPQRLARVDGLRLALPRRGRHPDRPGDEVRVALDDPADGARVGVVVQRVVGVLGLEVQRDRRALRRVRVVGDRVRALARGLPAHPGVPGRARDQGDAVGDHEAGVEADAELPDQLGRLLRRARLPGLPQPGQHLPGAGLRDRPDQVDDLVAGHPDPVVPHGQRALGGIGRELNVQVGRVDVQVLVAVRRHPQLVQRVRGVGDQLAQEHVLRRVDRVDHQLQQLTCLRLELDRLGRHRSRCAFLVSTTQVRRPRYAVGPR